MNINQAGMSALLRTTSGSETQSSARSGESSASGASDEKNLFMTLLVAQLKNQDPLDPQDSSAFVAQLAQFNTLDQLTQIRELLEQSLTGSSGNRESVTDTTGTQNQTTGEGLLQTINKGKSIVNNILENL